jgi:hypothetical protein
MQDSNERPVLAAGMLVRIRVAGTQDEWCPARVAVASDPRQPQQSVGLELGGILRAGSVGVILRALPLVVDYKAETAHDLFGNEYEIEIASLQVTYSNPE